MSKYCATNLKSRELYWFWATSDFDALNKAKKYFRVSEVFIEIEEE